MPYICGLPNDRASTFNILHSAVPYDTFWRMAPTRETLTRVEELTLLPTILRLHFWDMHSNC